MKKKIAGIIGLAIVAIIILFNGGWFDETPEEYLTQKYVDYEVVKTSQIGDVQAYLLQNETGMVMCCFYQGEVLGALGGAESNFDGMSMFTYAGDPYIGFVGIVCGENEDNHTLYSCGFFEGVDETANKCRVEREIAGEQYVLDIYLREIDTNFDYWLLNATFENGELIG